MLYIIIITLFHKLNAIITTLQVVYLFSSLHKKKVPKDPTTHVRRNPVTLDSFKGKLEPKYNRKQLFLKDITQGGAKNLYIKKYSLK